MKLSHGIHYFKYENENLYIRRDAGRTKKCIIQNISFLNFFTSESNDSQLDFHHTTQKIIISNWTNTVF